MILTYLILFIISLSLIFNTSHQTQVFWSYMFVASVCLLSYDISKIIFPNLHIAIGFIITFLIFSLLLGMMPYIGFTCIMIFAHIFTFGFLSKCPIGCVRTSIGGCDCV